MRNLCDMMRGLCSICMASVVTRTKIKHLVTQAALGHYAVLFCVVLFCSGHYAGHADPE